MLDLIARLNGFLDRHFPEADNEADTRRHRFIVVVACGTIPLCLVGVIHEWFVGNLIGVLINGGTFLTDVAVVELVRRGFGRYVPVPLVLLQLVACNVAAAAVGGASGSGFAGNFVVMVFAAIVLPRIWVAITALAMTGAAALMFAYPMENVVEFSDDMHVWTWFVCLALTGGMVAALVTVTEGLLYQAEERSAALQTTLDELRETSVSRDFVQGVLSALPEYVMVTDDALRIVMVNASFMTNGLWHRDDLLGRSLGDVLQGLPPGRDTGEGQLVLGDGSVVPVAVSKGELPGAGTNGAQYVWSATDIRVQHATAHALRQAHRRAQSASIAKSNFLANMSHELRTPLNAIIGYGELLTDELGDTAHAEDLGRIGGAAHTLLDLINGVLDLSRVEAGKIELQFEHVELRTIIEPVLALIEPLAAAKDLALVVDRIDWDGDTLYTDAPKLRQVLTNLLTNAVKFTHEGSVELLAERWDRSGLEWMRFTVTDTGIGIDAEGLQRVFEPFAQLNDATEFGGTGLGLSISSAFVEMMGGQVYAESEVGEGTRFVVEVPTAEFQRRRITRTPSQALPDAVEGQTILVVDDDERFLELVDRVLVDEGRQVVCTTDPFQGLEWTQKNRADVIVLDVAMPGVTGWSFLVRLREGRCASTPVVVISGEGDADVADALGATRFLRKPVKNEDLRHVVDEVLAT
jgi:signal transduction histidine kinase